jgi:hypothetical protein
MFSICFTHFNNSFKSYTEHDQHMDPKILTESGWKTLASKWKVKDNGLQRTLASYEKLDQKEYDERLKTVSAISKLADVLTKNDQVASVPVVSKYLDQVAEAADAEQKEIAKDKAQAQKQQAAAAAVQKKADDAQSKEEKQEEEQEAKYEVKLLAAFTKLKSSKGLAYEFILCDAKPLCAIMIAKQIMPKHKAELTKITDGGKRFLHPGTCQFQDGKFAFTVDQPVTGLARKLQASILHFTGKKLPILVGLESADEEDT